MVKTGKDSIKPNSKSTKKNQLDSMKLVSKIALSCSESKGSDLVVLELQSSTSATDSFVADFFVIVSGRSDRQVQGISNRIVEDMALLGIKPYSIEGMEDGQWVILDFGDTIVHVFYGPERNKYDLEGLWARASRYVVDETSSGIKLRAA
jgi:ribosome-associated protein